MRMDWARRRRGMELATAGNLRSGKLPLEGFFLRLGGYKPLTPAPYLTPLVLPSCRANCEGWKRSGGRGREVCISLCEPGWRPLSNLCDCVLNVPILCTLSLQPNHLNWETERKKRKKEMVAI